MATKRPANEINLIAKRAKSVMTLEKKIQVLDMLREGKKATEVGRIFSVNESTIRSIKKKENEIRNSVKSGICSSLKVTSQIRDMNIEKMEKSLYIWIEDNGRRNIPLTRARLMDKAKDLYCHFSGDINYIEDDSKFKASRGWFERFKSRFNLHNVKLCGESASADHQQAAKFPDEIRKLIEEKGYCPEQIFNADETGLYWKQMPTRTYISKNEKTAAGFKSAKDRVTLLLCANSSGDFITKPMLVYRAANPRALKNKDKDALPVYWRANAKAWMTSHIFVEWYKECFVKEVERYLKSKNLSFRVLLILDNATSHPVDVLKFGHPCVEVVFLPPNTTSLLQPLDQGVIKAFKSHYIRHAFGFVHEKLENDSSLSIKDVWKLYNIEHAIINIKCALNDIKISTVSNSWKKLLKKDTEKSSEVDEAIDKAVLSARLLPGDDFQKVVAADIESLVNEENEELSNADLEALLIESESGSDEDEVISPCNKLSLKELNSFIQEANHLAEKIVEMDPVMERSIKFKNGLNTLLASYKELQKDMQNKAVQPTIHSFFKPSCSKSVPEHVDERLS
ncbi:tigger transposable element-derived protein 1-like [Onthophagus taurus]|uniref:tigger transposable element-derived protein 1-like n=1 Tax=Onthophagus taurus TaxID=166361 RepID=UPI0039BDE10D